VAFKNLNPPASGSSVTETVYTGDGTSVTLGTVSSNLRTISGGGLSGVYSGFDPVAFDPDSLMSITTTSGKTLPAVSGNATSGHYSFMSSANYFIAGACIVFPGVIGDGCYFEVEDMECTTSPTDSYCRISIGALRLKQSPWNWGEWCGMELQPFTATDYWAGGCRRGGVLVTQTSATAMTAGLHTFRVEVTRTEGSPNEMSVVFKIDGVAQGSAMNYAPIAGANWAIGLAGASGAETWRFGTVTTGTM